jgi:hypothetical protein
MGVTGDAVERAEALVNAGVNAIIIDTWTYARVVKYLKSKS